MKTSRRKSTGRPAREDEHPQPYRAELVARLEQAVREGSYRPDPKAIAAAMIDRMDALLD